MSSTLPAPLRTFLANALIYGFVGVVVGAGIFVVLGALSGGLAIWGLAITVPLALLFSIPAGLLSAAVAPWILGPRRLQLIVGAMGFVITGLLTRGYLELVSGGPREIDPNPIALMFAIYAALTGALFGWLVAGFRRAALAADARVRPTVAASALGYRVRCSGRVSGRRRPGKRPPVQVGSRADGATAGSGRPE